MSEEVFVVNRLGLVIDTHNQAVIVTFDVKNSKVADGFGLWVVGV
jgi:hypothetical protein